MKNALETSRLKLRFLNEADQADYQRLLTYPEVALANDSLATPSKELLDKWFQADCKTPYAFVILDHDTDDFIGLIFYYQHTNTSGIEYDLGYVLDPRFWGLGIMPEAVLLSLNYVKEQTKQPQVVWATTLKMNHRSQRVLEKLNFELVLIPPEEAIKDNLVNKQLFRLFI